MLFRSYWMFKTKEKRERQQDGVQRKTDRCQRKIKKNVEKEKRQTGLDELTARRKKA